MNPATGNLKLMLAGLAVLLCSFGSSLVSAEQQVVQYGYDAASRLTSVVYSNTAAIRYWYDESGNRTRLLVVGPNDPTADHDSNTLYDLWEMINFKDIGNDPNADPDQDEYNNHSEFIAGTVPTDGESIFALNSVSNSPDGVPCITWPSATNRLYTVYITTNMLNPFSYWTNNIMATPPTNHLRDDVHTNDQRLYYNITVDYPGAP